MLLNTENFVPPATHPKDGSFLWSPCHSWSCDSEGTGLERVNLQGSSREGAGRTAGVYFLVIPEFRVQVQGVASLVSSEDSVLLPSPGSFLVMLVSCFLFVRDGIPRDGMRVYTHHLILIQNPLSLGEMIYSGFYPD